MDNGVHSALSTGINLFKLDAITLFNEVIPIALAVLITITVVYMALGWFLKLSGVGGNSDYVDRKNIMRDSPYWYSGIDYNDSKYDDYIAEHGDDE